MHHSPHLATAAATPEAASAEAVVSGPLGLKQALGTRRVTHWRRHRLPAYQWTACEGRTRRRFLASSHALNRTNGMAFLLLVALWLRAHGVSEEVTLQTDWGQEFGGDNPEQGHRIAGATHASPLLLAPVGARLARYPKGYNGRVERSHRTDDEEFYRPYALQWHRAEDVLRYAQRWVVFYNVYRPHFGAGMEGRPPFRPGEFGVLSAPYPGRH